MSGSLARQRSSGDRPTGTEPGGGGFASLVLLIAVLHLGLIAGILTLGITWVEGLAAFLLVQVIGFCVSGGYHRLMSHRSYKTSRVLQFFLAAGGCCALRGGPLWWASWHRYHHNHSDTDIDLFGAHRGHFWTYVGWMLSNRYSYTDIGLVHDLARVPELRLLNRFWLAPPLVLAAVLGCVAGPKGVLLVYCLATITVVHFMALVDVLNHWLGNQRYDTGDQSTNSLSVSLLTMGEGWHNNHHHYPTSARLGFYWWEVDGTFSLLKTLGRLGLVWGLREPSEAVLQRNRLEHKEADVTPVSVVPAPVSRARHLEAPEPAR